MHRFIERHARRGDRVSFIEHLAKAQIPGDSSRERDHRFAVLSCETGDSSRSFPLERLRVETTFAGNDQIACRDLILKVEDIRDHLES